MVGVCVVLSAHRYSIQRSSAAVLVIAGTTAPDPHKYHSASPHTCTHARPLLDT
jgi:hypothetical protein